MIIAGYNGGEPVKVLDRGGAIHDDRLDVFFDSHKEALEWGVRNLDIKLRRK
jgi:3D (Asp-Asp-Asp) domain-containing protein